MREKWFFIDSDATLQSQASLFLEKWNNNSPFQIKSSGTTGEPQLHTFNKNQLIQSAQASIAALGIDSQIRALLCLPLSSVGGLMLMARSLVGDFELFIQLPKSRPLQYQQEKIDFIAMVPTQLQQSLKFDINQLRNCSKILVGGGQLSPEIIAACQAANLQVWQSYGMTETLSHVALRKVSPTEDRNFKGLPGIQFSSQNGCLVISYPALQEQQIITKDIVNIEQTNCFQWLGRADNAINSGGFKIIPELLENKLQKYFNESFYITALPDPKWGEDVVIVFEGTKLPILPDFEQIGLKKEEIPKKYVLIPVFDRTETQKIKRKETIQFISNEDWRSL